MLVKTFLEQNGIKISKVAKDLGLSRTFVSLVVHGHKKSRPVAKHIESILKVSPGDLFPYTKEENNARGERLERTVQGKGINTD